jgi:hypothetical protein
VTLERQTNQQLGVRLSGWWMEQGIFILEIIPESPAAKSGKLEPYDRILSVNGEEVVSCRLDQASRLIQVCSMYQICQCWAKYFLFMANFNIVMHWG